MSPNNRYNKSYGLSNPLQSIFPEPVIAQRAPTSSDVGYRLGQIWVDVPTGQIYGLANIASGAATWSILGPGSSDVDTLTGDTGGALSPTGGNINILGGDLVTVDGSGSTLTINATSGAYPITQYVVGPVGLAGYQTVQSALDAIGAGGRGNIWIMPGTYTEDLTFPAASFIGLVGTCDETTGPTIVGTHTPANDGDIVTWRVAFTSTGHVFSSAGAGTSNLTVVHNNFIYEGYLYNLPNWTSSGSLTAGLIADRDSTNSGIINNTAGTTVFLFQSSLGNGTLYPMIVSGASFLERVDFGCPITMQGAGESFCYSNQYEATVTIQDSQAVVQGECYSIAPSGAAYIYNSSGDSVFNTCGISTTNNPAIDGTGSGTLKLSGVSFDNNANMAATLTISGGTTVAGTFSTSDQAAGLTISGNDIDADGSDANISITVTPKGSGDFVVDLGNIQNTSGDIIATHSTAGGDVTLEATNSDNTNNASRAGVELAVGGTSAGDPYANFLISGGQTFTMGIDNSTANDDFVISDSNALGTTNRVSIDGSSGVVTLVNGLTSTGTTSILASVNANTSINTGTSTGTVSIGNSAAGAITVDTAAGISLDAATASNFTSSLASSAAAITISASAADGGITLDAGATPGVTFTNGTQSHQMLVGSGSPNGSVTASQGSLYVDVGGSTSTTILFVNTDGSTTWVGVGA